jgi:hypothetical protein
VAEEFLNTKFEGGRHQARFDKPGSCQDCRVWNPPARLALSWVWSSVMTGQDNERSAAGARRKPVLDPDERERIQRKQGGHHYPPRPEDGPPMDDTDRNTDKIIKPSRLPKRE